MHSMVIRASEPRRSANSSWAEPKISRKSLARNSPSLRAADAVMVFIDILRLRHVSQAVQIGPSRAGTSRTNTCDRSGNDLHHYASHPPHHDHECPVNLRIFTKYNHTDRYKSRQRREKCADGA